MADIQQLEKNKIKLTIKISPELFKEGVSEAYEKNKYKYSVQGFRKGKVPKAVIELNYGKSVFYEDAVNYAIQKVYNSEIKNIDKEIVSKPNFILESEPSVENGALISSELYTKPYDVSITTYKGLKYKKIEMEVTEEEIMSVINSEREKNSRIITITDRPAENGDTVTIDFEGFIDGKAFEGSKSDNFSLVIGSKTFIDNFEEQIIGHNTSDEFEVNVNFPNDYGKTDLRGAKAMFKVRLNEIKFKELPELDDDFVKEISEYDNLDEYKASIKDSLTPSKLNKSRSNRENAIMQELIKNTVCDLPEPMIDNRLDFIMRDLESSMQKQGISLNDYLKYIGQSPRELRHINRSMARDQALGRLALEQIVKIENLTLNENELKSELESIAKSRNMDYNSFVSLITENDKQMIANDTLVKKALNFVVENAIEEE